MKDKGEGMPGNMRRRVADFTIASIAIVFAADCQAACLFVPLVGDNSYVAEMEKKMSTAHGVGMKKLVQKGNYAGKFTIVWYRFGSAKEIEDATAVQIADSGAPPAVRWLQLQSNHSEANLARLRTLATASVGYFTRVGEGDVAPEIDAMLKKSLAAEPTNEEVVKPGFKLPTTPSALHRWGDVQVSITPSPRALDIVSVDIRKVSCK